jgi:peroxiredoxin
MKAYQELLPEITSAGATLIGVTPEKPDNALSTIEKNALTYPVLTDAGNEFAKALGLVFELTGDLKALYAGFGLDLPNVNQDTGWTLPIPAVYVVGADGKILFADVDLNYTRRAEPSDAIAALKAI